MIHPKKAAENSALMGSWQHSGLRYKIPRAHRKAWHRDRKQGLLGEQLDRSFGIPTHKSKRNSQANKLRNSPMGNSNQQNIETLTAKLFEPYIYENAKYKTQ